MTMALRTTAFLMMALLGSGVARAEGKAVGKITFQGETLRPAVVYVEKAATPPKPGPAVKMEQRGSQFVPRVLIVQVGQGVEFPNADKFFHNVFSLSLSNAFDLGLYRGGMSKTQVMG